MSDINVKVSKWGKRKNLAMFYVCPQAGRRVMRSTGTHRLKDAQKAAGKWEDELRAGRYKPASKMTWAEFTDRYVNDAMPALAPKTRQQTHTVFNTIERLIRPKLLADITASRLTGMVAALRDESKSPATIQSYLKQFHAVLSWAVDQEYLKALPKFPKAGGKKAQASGKMKGRPIGEEEFDRMLSKVPYVLSGGDLKAARKASGRNVAGRLAKRKPAASAMVDAWRLYLRGLWLSGLRLRESINLYWEAGPGRLSVDTTNKYPMLRIPGEAQKSGKDQLCPMAPEFAMLLLSVPEDQRRGRVFKLPGMADEDGNCPIITDGDWVSRIVSRFGKAAGVKVNETAKRRAGKNVTAIKFASAHDLRRSFGFRWSRRIMPAELKELMRHEDINTTMQYYVGQNAENTAESLWKAAGMAMHSSYSQPDTAYLARTSDASANSPLSRLSPENQ